MLDSFDTYARERLEEPLAPKRPQAAVRHEKRRLPHLQLAVFGVWAALIVLLGPRLIETLSAAQGAASYASLSYFIVFTLIAWLYGIYNIAVVGFAMHYRRTQPAASDIAPIGMGPQVALLYTTCNDFVEASAESCMDLSYANYTMYVLDDSSDALYRARVDAFAARHPGRVRVVRRADRQGFKAGNMNNALKTVAREPFFAVVDADEILPRDFLSRLVPRMLADPQCGFIQANHRCMDDANNALKSDMRIGIDVHWRWYQPLRNRYGFVMFLGHGALLRRSCWEEIGGFPEIVSEDLGYAIAIRERGYFGTFAEDVVCLEEFPETVRAFRVRHVKWTRGTCEFLHQWTRRILKAPMSWTEKLDILFPTMNLPLTFFFFLFMINASIVLPALLGETRIMTVELGATELLLPVITIPAAMTQLFTWDFYFVTVACLVGPVLCFIAELWRQPGTLVRFLAHSTALYASLSPLSAISVIGYGMTGKARFLVTGDKGRTDAAGPARTLRQRVVKFFSETHPDSAGVRAFEFLSATVFFAAAAASFQVALLGLAIGFFMLPLMHLTGWGHGARRTVAWLPFLLVLAGVPLGGLGLLGVQPMMFGFGFHF
jgi:cellulose synthase/poly-beta-1,6-N-acetylglucosamine synthase-like glycosyltransferase